jgi:transposase
MENCLNNSKIDNLNQKEWLYSQLTKDAKHTQEWKEYNEAQTKEKLMLYKLLYELLNIVPTRAYAFGRPRKSLRDMLFCCLIKIYSNTSSRRTISDLKLAKEAGYIEDVPHFNTLLNYFNDAGLSIILPYLISVSALPLKGVEEKFAIDSTGFGTKMFGEKWLNVRTGKDSEKRGYKKCHIICGTKTNIITSAIITEGKANDSPLFTPLLTNTAQFFNVKEITADKGYSSKANLELAKELQIMPYIPFKSNVTGKSGGSPIWAEMFKYFTENYMEFAEHYHQRSNVESTFAMIKKKFGDFIRCKTDESQNNEILCKLLVHNITCLIHEIFELKIEVNFLKCSKKLPAQKVV